MYMSHSLTVIEYLVLMYYCCDISFRAHSKPVGVYCLISPMYRHGKIHSISTVHKTGWWKTIMTEFSIRSQN